MANLPEILFTENTIPQSGILVVLLPKSLAMPKSLAGSEHAAQIKRHVEIEKFKGKLNASISLVTAGGDLSKIILLGCGEVDKLSENDCLKLGGKLSSMTGKAEEIFVLCESEEGGALLPADAIANVAMGVKLGAYQFDDYLTKGREFKKLSSVKKSYQFGAENHGDAAAKWQALNGVSDGVLLARQLVNEPANVLGPVEFAAHAEKLSELGVEVEILTDSEMEALGMHALLGVAIGSEKPARMAIMKWMGGNKDDQPLAFIGKGVVFDTGGISIKPSGGMEDMKGDMGGAAAVIGLMHALAARKANANVIGILGLVENMPDGKAQRPGDIVTSMSGQTIEIINTDAEGRLVLADALWYCQDRFKPKFMINLATLTGAILVALGKEYAGIFSNDDELAENLFEAGKLTEEKVWRLPLHEEFDKLIDTKNADMKNTGGRNAGSITAAQFLQRFVNDTPWVHIDVAGTAMAAKTHEFNQSWGSGFGVRLLDRLVSEFYESKQ